VVGYGVVMVEVELEVVEVEEEEEEEEEGLFKASVQRQSCGTSLIISNSPLIRGRPSSLPPPSLHFLPVTDDSCIGACRVCVGSEVPHTACRDSPHSSRLVPADAAAGPALSV
jgi:hypothetical protein